METLYDILGVARDATPQQIKAAWKALATKIHPDKLGENAPVALVEYFKKAGKAYEILSGHETRAAYDSELRTLEEMQRKPPTIRPGPPGTPVQLTPLGQIIANQAQQAARELTEAWLQKAENFVIGKLTKMFNVRKARR